ncbi:MAG TPA: 50S ribosome-binding GTPase [Candidatus Hydrogenedentes bacterium]|nr:50S ribosome-binding GTPase [Candidatus Hydrogenedentota bacterium]
MLEEMLGELPLAHSACAFFMGDFNTGKSAMINALARREVLPAGRDESHALPTLLTRANGAWAEYAALSLENMMVSVTHEEFLAIRRTEGNPEGYRALAARMPSFPFQYLTLADTAGMSSDARETARLSGLEDATLGIMVVVTDIEYWSAKHTMEFIAAHQEVFDGSLVVAANKADLLNAGEIRRLGDRAAKRMEDFGIRPAPRFFPVSARVESGRGLDHHEYRARIKREVRDLCDAGFDALRVALYEFEAAQGPGAFCPSFDDLFAAPLISSFIRSQQGAQQ